MHKKNTYRKRGKEDGIVYFTDDYSSWQKGCIENTKEIKLKTYRIEFLYTSRVLLPLFHRTLHNKMYLLLDSTGSE